MNTNLLGFVWLLVRLVCFAPLFSEAEGLEELVFDVTTLNTDDYVIKWAEGEYKSYEFTPKPDRIIDEVKFRGLYVWKRHGDFQLESVIIHYFNADSLKYALNVVDGNNNKQSLHFSTLGNSYWKMGIIEYLHNTHYLMFHNAKPLYSFDLTSNFDKSFYLTQQREDKELKVFEFRPLLSYSFENVSDGEELIYSNAKDKIDYIHFTTKDDTNFLLNLRSNKFKDLYFIFSEGKWETLGRNDYEKLYKENRLLFLTTKLDSSSNDRIVDLSLTNDRHLNKRKQYLINLPTIKYSVPVLKELREGPDVILMGGLKDAEIILYKGHYSFDMIEVTHNLNTEYINQYYKNISDEIKDENTLRGLNYYFIKKDGNWTSVSQNTFFKRFKNLLTLNLEQANKTASSVNVKHNLVLIEKLKTLEAFDTTKRYLTEEFSFTTVPNLLETPNSDPIHSEPEPKPIHPVHNPTPSSPTINPSTSTSSDDPTTPKPTSPNESHGSVTEDPTHDDPYETAHAEAQAKINKIWYDADKASKTNLKKTNVVIKKKSGFYTCSGLFIFAYFLI